MYAEPFALKSAAESTWNFYRLPGGGAGGTNFVEAGNTGSLKVTARINHSRTGKSKSNDSSTNRHNLSLALERLNETTNKFDRCVGSFTFTIAEGDTLLEADIDAIAYAVGDFLRGTQAATYMDKFRRGEA